MQLADLLLLLREDFSAQLETCTEAFEQWRANPAQPNAPVRELLGTWERTGQAGQMVGLLGFGAFLAQLESFAKSRAYEKAAVSDADLQWLSRWHEPALAYLNEPGTPEAAEHILGYLRAAPHAVDAGAMQELASLLAQAPSLPDDLANEGEARVDDATAADVDLSLADIDASLFDTFLADAPSQVERLAEFGERLAKGGLSLAQLQEAQRIAHTFKGSGNIIGLPGIGRLAHRVEDIFDHTIERIGNDQSIPKPMARDALAAIGCLAQMVGHLAGHDAAPSNAVEVLQRLIDWVNAIRQGESDEWEPEPLSNQAALGVVSAAAIGSGDAAPEATALEPIAAASSTEQLRVPVERMNRLMRRAGQSLVYADRYNQFIREAVERLERLETTHRNLNGKLRELELAVEKQAVTLNEKKEAGLGFDPLEMDRYDTLHLLQRSITEIAQDELELSFQAKAQAQRMHAMLRDQSVQLRDQHRDLIEARLVPVKSVAARLKRNVAQTAATTQKLARLEIVGESVTVDSEVLNRLTEPLLHLLRNAVDHGIEPPEERLVVGKPEEGVVRLVVQRKNQDVELVCQDDGRGLDLQTIFEKAVAYGLVDANAPISDDDIARLILRPGFSTRDVVTEVSGRGVGLDVVADRIRALKGSVDIQFEQGAGTKFVLRVPVSAGTAHSLIVRCEGEPVALAAEDVVVGMAPGQGQFATDGKGLVFVADGKTYLADTLAHWLGFDAAATDVALLNKKSVVLVRGQTETVALAVDAILEARELILQELSQVLRRVPGLVAASQRADGQPLFLVSMPELQRSQRARALAGGKLRGPNLALRRRAETQRTAVLLVDDSLSVRKSMSQLLDDAGYEAVLAVDGAQAIELLRSAVPTVVITDLEMPNVNGLELTQRIREVPAWQHLPVIMITSRASDKHRSLAMEAGVDTYLTKPYNDIDLLAQVRKCVQSGRNSGV